MSALLILAAAALPAADGQPDDTTIVPGTPIFVTGHPLGDLPASGAYDVSTIDRTRIATAASGRVEDALGDVAGLQLFRRSDSRAANPSSAGFTLRGLGGNAASRTLVLLDGVPQADPFFGSVPLTGINAADLAAIRVIHGGGSGAFGAGAVAGTIDMTSAGPDARGTFDAEALVDDRGDTSLAAGVAPRLGNGFAVLSGRWDRGPGFWTTPVEQRSAASARARYESWSLALRNVAQVAPGIELQTRIAAFSDAQTLRFVGADSGMSGQDASARVIGRGPWQFDVLVYGQLRDFTNLTLSTATFKPVNNQRATPSSGIGGKIEVRPPLGPDNVLRLGADWRELAGYEDEDIYTKGVVTSRRREGGTNDDLGIYAEHAWTLGRMQLTGGARADHTAVRDGRLQTYKPDSTPLTNTAYASRSQWTGSFRGGVLVHATNAIDLRGSAYTGLRQPTLNELYRSFSVFPVTTLANPALVNERLRGIEAGFDWRPVSAIALHLTAFDNEIRNAIANIKVNSSTQLRQNVPAVRAHGVEAATEVHTGTLMLSATLAYTVARMDAPGQDYDGLRPPQTARINASGTASWTPRPGWTLAVTLRHVGVAYEDSLNTAALPPATTLGAFATLPLTGPFSLVLRGENLTDTRVVTRNSGGTVFPIDLGTPRTVWAGIRARLP